MDKKCIKDNIVFLDIEADQEVNNKKSKRFLLQLSAIKFENNQKTIFNEFCYRKEITTRISNLLKKPINFYSQFNSKPIEIIKKFVEFANGCKILSFGNFDQVIVNDVIRSEEKYNEKIRIIDMQGFINYSLKIKKNSGLDKISKLLKIPFKNEHDPLEDVNVFMDSYFKILNNDFDLDEIEKRHELYYYLPKKSKNEYVRFDLQDNNKLAYDFNFIFITSKQRTVKNEVNNDIDNDFTIWSNMINDYEKIVNKKTFHDISIEVMNYKHEIIDKKIISVERYESIEDINLITISNNSNNLIITNSINLINVIAHKLNKILFYINVDMIKFDLNNKPNLVIDDLKNKIKKAQMLFN